PALGIVRGARARLARVHDAGRTMGHPGALAVCRSPAARPLAAPTRSGHRTVGSDRVHRKRGLSHHRDRGRSIMATRLTRFLALVVLALVACHAENAAHGLRPGQILAPLSLHALDGSAISTASFRGRIVVMNFWATWCAPCRAEMDALQKLADDLDPHRFAVIGVSVDNDVNLVQESTLRHDWRFARFVDT